jgi:hypothetical protein
MLQAYVCKYFICLGRMLQEMLYVASVAYDQAQEVGADRCGPSCVREAKRAWRPPHACAGACVPQQEVGPDRQV